MIDAINSNKNISQEDKETIINGLFNTLQLDSKYYDEEHFEEVLFAMSNLTITRVETIHNLMVLCLLARVILLDLI